MRRSPCDTTPTSVTLLGKPRHANYEVSFEVMLAAIMTPNLKEEVPYSITQFIRTQAYTLMGNLFT